jgi:hypothetical protein
MKLRMNACDEVNHGTRDKAKPGLGQSSKSLI